jgi:drug/metabolite transporter (DMT)-like permease
VAVALALLAAVSFAAGTVLQQRGTLQAPAGADDARFLVQILHEPVWLAGGTLQIGGWILQAAALDRGSLVVVQALCTLSLVIALPLGARLTNQHVGRSDVLAAFAVLAGIVVFVSAGAPAAGSTNPSAAEWWSAGILAILLIGGAGGYGRRRDGAMRAALFGGAAGVAYALQAAVTKVFVGELGNGAAALLHHWTTYVLVVSAIVGFVLQQSALKTGVLAPAMASSNASTLIFSTVFGIVVFDEHLSRGGGKVAIALAGLALAVGGVIRLAAIAPQPSTPPGTTSDPQARAATPR